MHAVREDGSNFTRSSISSLLSLSIEFVDDPLKKTECINRGDGVATVSPQPVRDLLELFADSIDNDSKLDIDDLQHWVLLAVGGHMETAGEAKPAGRITGAGSELFGASELASSGRVGSVAGERFSATAGPPNSPMVGLPSPPHESKVGVSTGSAIFDGLVAVAAPQVPAGGTSVDNPSVGGRVPR